MNKEEVADHLYNVNAWISLHWIGLNEIPNDKTIGQVNARLAEIIKEIREL